MSRPSGNGGRDALKFGELFAVEHRMTTPSQVSAFQALKGVETGRARPT
ncbi:MAG: hypothetical protein JO060_03420 [Candidatus Eremiobacteraeota bacterium]|nr:hypothetical protein [Candidatus Eremiobacteraeota bacterium]MBV9648390.1 hypothetical protein [Candidatus Eremiobacteraeota bacterium]